MIASKAAHFMVVRIKRESKKEAMDKPLTRNLLLPSEL